MKNRKLWLLLGGIVLVLVLAVTPLMAGCAAPEEVKPPVEKPPVEKPPVEKPPVEKPPVEKPPEEVWELTHSDFCFEGSTTQIANWKWMDEIEKRTNGRVLFTGRYHSMSLFGGFEVLGAVGAGACDTGTLASIYTPAELDLHAGMGGIPMITDYPMVWMLAATEMLRTDRGLIEEARRNNVIYLNAGPAVEFVPVTTSPITSPADLKGMKLLCPTAATMYAVQMMGAIPTAVEQAEIYEGLARGLLDGLVVSLSDIYTLKLYELCKYLTCIGLGATGGFPLSMNLDTWNSFPPDIQKIILDTADDQMRYFQDAVEEQDVTMGKAMREEGAIFSALSPEEIQGFKDLGVIDYCIDQWVKVKPEQEQERRAFVARFFETIKAIKVEPWMYATATQFK